MVPGGQAGASYLLPSRSMGELSFAMVFIRALPRAQGLACSRLVGEDVDGPLSWKRSP